MAQELLRPMPSLLSYHINRAVAQADVVGGLGQRPRAWRFVVLRFAPGEVLAFTPEQNEMVAQDHVNCLYRLRSHRRRGDRPARPPGRPARAGEVPARGRPGAGRQSTRAGWRRSARWPTACSRAMEERLRRSAAVPQPRAQRGRVRAARRRRPAADRAARRDDARGLHRGLLRSRALGRGGPGRRWWPRARCACPSLVDVNLLRVEERGAARCRD